GGGGVPGDAVATRATTPPSKASGASCPVTGSIGTDTAGPPAPCAAGSREPPMRLASARPATASIATTMPPVTRYITLLRSTGFGFEGSTLGTFACTSFEGRERSRFGDGGPSGAGAPCGGIGGPPASGGTA